MLQTPAPSGFKAVLDSAKTIAEILGLGVGGAWAYYKFFKGRTFRPRLELTVEGRVRRAMQVTHLAARVQINNVGLSKLELSQKGSGLRISSQAPTDLGKMPAIIEWNHQITLPVFEKHRWIEPGETISDQTLIALAHTDRSAIKLELRIVSSGIEWNSLTIVDPDSQSDTA